jgi:ketopantoate reductase
MICTVIAPPGVRCPPCCGQLSYSLPAVLAPGAVGAGGYSARSMARPKVALVGVGSVGGTIAAALDSCGRCDLTLIARGDSLAALQRDGLVVLQPFQESEYRCSPPCVSTDATSELGPQDYVFVVTKAHQFPTLLESLLPLCGPHTVVVPCMNGIPYWYNYVKTPADPAGAIAPVDPDGRLWSVLGADRAIGAVVKVGGHLDAPGVTVQGGPGVLEFGEPDGSDSPRLAQLLSLFEPQGAEAELPVEELAVPFSVVKRGVIREAVWDKLVRRTAPFQLSRFFAKSIALRTGRPPGSNLSEVLYQSPSEQVFNVVGNVLTTLTQSTNGDVTADPQVRKRVFLAPFYTKYDHFTKTGTGQT